MADEKIIYPFTAFNFSVEITKEGTSNHMCEAKFSDCDGLEMSMEIKTVREGGNNNQQIRFAGPVSYGQLTLKRGMTDNFDLWHWFTDTISNPGLRADADIVLLAADFETVRARFILNRCVPIKIKAPTLNAKDGAIAIEEMQLAYQELTLVEPQSTSTV